MLLALLMGAPDAVDAERAFAARAQVAGQWTSFRETAAADAVLFVPDAVNAQAWLKDRRDPPQSVMWWPAQAFVSCDGTTVATTGPWLRAGGASRGYFTTLWARQPDGGWKWIVDHGDALAKARPAGGGAVKPVRADCGRPQTDAMPTRPPGETAMGASPDKSLEWVWVVHPGKSRRLSVRLWTGKSYKVVINDEVAAETP